MRTKKSVFLFLIAIGFIISGLLKDTLFLNITRKINENTNHHPIPQYFSFLTFLSAPQLNILKTTLTFFFIAITFLLSTFFIKLFLEKKNQKEFLFLYIALIILSGLIGSLYFISKNHHLYSILRIILNALQTPLILIIYYASVKINSKIDD